MRFLRDAGLILLLFVLPAFSQSPETPVQQQQPPEQSAPADTPADQAAPEQSAPGETPPGPVVHRHHRRACWRVAGISADLVNQRWHIEDQGRSQIATVCRDPKTTAQQKQEKIQAIHEETNEEIAKIIPADKLKAYNACQAEEDKLNPKPKPLPGEKQLGPCGGIIPHNAESGMGDMHDH